MQSHEANTPAEVEFVTFFTGGQSFSIDITQVREIRRWTSATPLPHAPTEVLGVMNLRGSVIPIYDLAARFGLEPTKDNGRNVVVIAAHENQTVGLLVESVSEILSVARDRIQEMPNLRSETARQNITGVILVGDDMTRVVDLGAIIQAGQETRVMTLAAAHDLSATGATAGFAFTDDDFAVIARRAHQDFGLHLTLAKKDLVYSRLAKRLRQLGLTDFRAYCHRIEAENAAEERLQMLSALTTNVTHFFREEHHFRSLRDTVLPPLLKAARSGGRVRLWSAGCSAGQEPYSLAFTLLDLCPEAAALDIRILATDVDPVIIARARAATYDNEELKSLPDHIRDKHTRPVGNGTFAIDTKARDLIRFAELNLMEPWPFAGPFDVIFCRNVAIYFDKTTQARLWQRFAGLLPPGGHLCIGHSERISGPAADWFQGAGVTTYRKSHAGPAQPPMNPENGTRDEP